MSKAVLNALERDVEQARTKFAGAALSAAGKYVAPYLPEASLQIAGFLVSFAVISLLFAMMFKWLPDTPIEWRDVWLGAILTAALFEVGKLLIGLYIGKQGLESTYGAAASIVVVLIWVYYSAQLAATNRIGNALGMIIAERSWDAVPVV